jgi:uncharacterized protein (TIGR02001 family)
LDLHRQCRPLQPIRIPRHFPNNEKPALQGGFDLGHKSGFYVGTWASNISWVSDGNSDVSASLEWDFYGGYKWALPADFTLDLGVLYYYYPGSYPTRVHEARHDRAVRRAHVEMAHRQIQLQRREQDVRIIEFARVRLLGVERIL